MTRQRLLVVGEAPARVHGVAPLQGDAGARLARLAGLSHARLLDAVDAVNLLDAWPGASGPGSAFPRAEARAAAAALAPALRGRRVVLLGARVAQAFGVNTSMLARWRVITRLGARVAVVPHPSGVCRSYNDSATRERVSRFLRQALGVTATDAAPRPLPWCEDDDDRVHA